MFIVYGYPSEVNKCIGCETAKRLLTAKNIDFEFVEIAKEKDENGQPILIDSIIDDLKTKTGKDRLSAPLIFEDDKFIGGFNELRVLITKR